MSEANETKVSNTVRVTFASAPDLKKGKHVKDAIRPLLLSPEVWIRIEPYVTNGGVTGHKMMDMTHVVDIIIEADKSAGKVVASFGLSEFQLANAIKMTMRERLELDTNWKVIGVRKRITHFKVA